MQLVFFFSGWLPVWAKHVKHRAPQFYLIFFLFFFFSLSLSSISIYVDYVYFAIKKKGKMEQPCQARA